MGDKSLEKKAIDIKGSKYVLVSDRVVYFNEEYKNGSIETRLVSSPDADLIVMQAVVTPDLEKPARRFVDYAQELVGSSFINKTSAMENASTSAIGRALALMGIGVIDSIASVDEINKANNRTTGNTKTATPKQVEWILDEIDKKQGIADPDKWFEEKFGRKIKDVPLYQVKDVVDKIRNVKSAPLDDAVEVTDEDIKKLENGELIY